MRSNHITKLFRYSTAIVPRQMARLFCVMVAVLMVLLQVYAATAGYHGVYRKLHHVGHDDSFGYDDDSYEVRGYRVVGGYGGGHGAW